MTQCDGARCLDFGVVRMKSEKGGDLRTRIGETEPGSNTGSGKIGDSPEG